MAIAGANMVTKSVDIATEALTPAPTVRAPARLPGRVPPAARAPLRVTRPGAPAAPLAAPGLVQVD